MEMLLMGICISIFGMAIAAAAFGAAVRREETAPEVQLQPQASVAATAITPLGAMATWTGAGKTRSSWVKETPLRTITRRSVLL